jgi:hypothetical protein
MNKIRILITTTSFQDTPGRYHDLLAGDAYDIERARGVLRGQTPHAQANTLEPQSGP